MNQDISGTSGSYKWLVLVTVAIANFSAALDTSIVIISFPRLTDVFNTDASIVVWLVIAFSIAELGLLLTLAKVGDTIGRKKVYVSGLILYTLGLIFCSVSPNISLLIISRIVQGAGAAMTLTVGGAIVVAVFPDEQRGRAIGILAMLVSLGLIAGPALGGLIIDHLDWQGLFYTRIPVGVISIIMAIMIIKEQKEPGAHLQLDIGGALALLGFTSCLLLYLNLGGDWGYLSINTLAFGIAAIVLLGIFIFIETKVTQPILDLRLFRSRVFTMASVTNLIQMMGGSQGPVLVPFFLIGGLLLSASTIGLLIALIAIPPVILSPISGWLSDKIGNRIPMVFATICFSAGLFLASRWDIDSKIIEISLVMVLFGTGMGIFMAPNQSAVIGAAPSRNLATALGVANAMRLLGASIGTALGGTLYASQLSASQAKLAAQNIAPDMIDRLSAVESFQFVILLATFVSIASILTAAFTGKKKSFDNNQIKS